MKPKSYKEAITGVRKGVTQGDIIRVNKVANGWLHKSVVATLHKYNNLKDCLGLVELKGTGGILVRPCGGKQVILTFPMMELRDRMIDEGTEELKVHVVEEQVVSVNKTVRDESMSRSSYSADSSASLHARPTRKVAEWTDDRNMKEGDNEETLCSNEVTEYGPLECFGGLHGPALNIEGINLEVVLGQCDDTIQCWYNKATCGEGVIGTSKENNKNSRIGGSRRGDGGTRCWSMSGADILVQRNLQDGGKTGVRWDSNNHVIEEEEVSSASKKQRT
ncbi:hypothetical protein Dimus_026750 [Dionaea muscipula]